MTSQAMSLAPAGVLPSKAALQRSSLVLRVVILGPAWHCASQGGAVAGTAGVQHPNELSGPNKVHFCTIQVNPAFFVNTCYVLV